MSGPQLRQLTEMRELLEVNALRFAVRRGGEAFSRTLDRIIEAMTKTVEDQDPVAYRLCDAQFHQAIIDGCGNPFIGSAYNIIALRVQAFRNRLSLEAQNWRSLEEHRQVARLAQALDADAAAACLLDHIRGAINDYFARTEKEFSRAG
jgi:DNA-binding GntR family transcriptional regulator